MIGLSPFYAEHVLLLSLFWGAAGTRHKTSLAASVRGVEVPWPVLVAIIPVSFSMLPFANIEGIGITLTLFGRSAAGGIEALAAIRGFYALGKGLRRLLPEVLPASNRGSPVFATTVFRAAFACSSLAALVLLAQVMGAAAEAAVLHPLLPLSRHPQLPPRLRPDFLLPPRRRLSLPLSRARRPPTEQQQQQQQQQLPRPPAAK